MLILATQVEWHIAHTGADIIANCQTTTHLPPLKTFHRLLLQTQLLVQLQLQLLVLVELLVELLQSNLRRIGLRRILQVGCVQFWCSWILQVTRGEHRTRFLSFVVVMVKPLPFRAWFPARTLISGPIFFRAERV